jgi:hypothetical protein
MASQARPSTTNGSTQPPHNNPSTAAGAANDPTKSYFESQRELLLTEIAQVRYDTLYCSAPVLAIHAQQTP